jgi:hypothetical protein
MARLLIAAGCAALVLVSAAEAGRIDILASRSGSNGDSGEVVAHITYTGGLDPPYARYGFRMSAPQGADVRGRWSVSCFRGASGVFGKTTEGSSLPARGKTIWIRKTLTNPDACKVTIRAFTWGEMGGRGRVVVTILGQR